MDGSTMSVSVMLYCEHVDVTLLGGTLLGRSSVHLRCLLLDLFDIINHQTTTSSFRKSIVSSIILRKKGGRVTDELVRIEED